MRAIFGCIAVFFICTYFAAPVAVASTFLTEPKDTHLKQVLYSYTLENTIPRTLNKVAFVTYAPVKKMTFQHCTSIVGSHPSAIQVNEFGNQIIRFSFDAIPPFARKIVSIQAGVQQHRGAGWPTESDPSRYLQPARYIETKHPKIVHAAKGLSNSDPMKAAEKIHRFVSESIRPAGYSSQEYGAVYALEHGKGDCTESMYLFVALCRAVGLPARGIGGYRLTVSAVLKPSQYHNWAEFHDGRTWRIADPQRKGFAVNQSDYIAMKILHDFPEREDFPFHRFHASDNRVKVTMNE
jgi:hypothetical protein